MQSAPARFTHSLLPRSSTRQLVAGVSIDEMQRFFTCLAEEQVRLMYVQSAVGFGVPGEDDPAVDGSRHD